MQLSLFSAQSRYWRGIVPREWQREALPKALACIDAGDRGLISAVMGSGKSVFLAEILLQRPPPPGFVNVVTTPTQRLVLQLAATCTERGLDAGRFYADEKRIAPVVVCCQPSVPELVDRLKLAGKQVWLWIADEAHKTAAESMITSAALLDPRSAIGCTATPFLSDERARLSLWPKLLHTYTAAQAFADGVVVRPELMLWDGAEAPLDAVCVNLIRRVVAKGPGLANASSIADAEVFTATCKAAGLRAMPVHSRLSVAEVAERIDRLQRGDLDLLVHVNMLSEGVDLPWLRWLCMRRDVGSRVRFCQEVGRVLRSSPGKDRAWLLDPHDLFDTFGLTYEAMLAGATVEKDAPELSELDQLAAELAAIMRLPRLSVEAPEKTVQGLEGARRYVRRLYLAFVSAGVVEQKIAATAWRRNPPSAAQLKYACKGIGVLLKDTAVPMQHRRALQAVSERSDRLLRGDVSDLLSVLFSLKDRRRLGLPWPVKDT